MKDIFQKILDTFGNLSFNQRVMLGTLAVAAVLIMVFFYNSAQEDFDIMLSGLDEADAGAVVHNLKKQGIPYRLAEGGTTILVPRSRKEELRLDAFQEDLIKSNKTVGFGALGSLPFGLTDWQEQKYDQKIISDEVVTTLERIQGIKKARVILAQSQDSLYATDKLDPKASVMLIVEPGFRLKPDQVKTIKNLVAHSVPGLKVDNVAISDSMGNLLTDDITASQGLTGDGSVDSMRTTFEKQKAKDILEMLVAVVGPNNAVVKVSAHMNFDRTESHIKRFIPTGGTPDNPTGIPVSVQRNMEVYTGKAKEKPEGGEAGTSANTPQYSGEEPPKEEPGSSDYNNEQITTNYEVSSEEKTIVHAPGTVDRMTIAVVVNKVLTESQSKELTDLVASASGADMERGDVITVSGLQFSPEVQEQQKESMDILKQTSQQEMIMNLVQMVGVFVLSMLALFIFYKLLYRPAYGELVEDEEEEYIELPRESSALLTAASIPVLEAKLDPEIEHMRESIHSMVTKDPAEAARVLLTYMKDL